MARRGHYGFERRRREDAKRAKQQAKRTRRQDREATGAAGPEMGEAPETQAPQGLWEWFSPSRARIVTSPVGTRPPSETPDDWVLLTEASGETDQAGQQPP